MPTLAKRHEGNWVCAEERWAGAAPALLLLGSPGDGRVVVGLDQEQLLAPVYHDIIEIRCKRSLRSNLGCTRAVGILRVRAGDRERGNSAAHAKSFGAGDVSLSVQRHLPDNRVYL